MSKKAKITKILDLLSKLGIILMILSIMLFTFSTWWYPVYGKNHRLVAFVNDEDNVDFFEQFLTELDEYSDIPDWVYSKLKFVKDNSSFTRYANSEETLKYGEEVPRLILKQGLGKCEEFSVIAASMAVTMGYEVRIVKNFPPGDHVWIEVKINNTWIHMDPSEKIIDQPHYYYENNWTIGKVVAFKTWTCEDVTSKYKPSLYE